MEQIPLLKNHDTVVSAKTERANSNYLLAQKRKNLNNSKLKHRLIKFNFVAFMLLFSFASCEASEKPRDPGELPFGVFPLNDVSWVHSQGLNPSGNPADEFIYDDETDELIAIIRYTNGGDMSTYSVRQIGENRAELYVSKIITWYRTKWDYITNENSFDDTTWVIPHELYGYIYLENRRIYFRGLDIYGKPWNERELLYDFNLKVGDEFIILNSYIFSVVSIDSALIENEYRKRYNFEFKFEAHPGFPKNRSFSVIEGIGNTQNLFYTLEDPFMPDPPPLLREVYYKDRKIWRKF